MTETIDRPVCSNLLMAHVADGIMDDYLAGTEIVVTTSGTLLQGAPVVYQPRRTGDRYPWYAIAPGTACSGWRYRTDEVGTE